MEVEINGVKYQAKTPNQVTPKKPSKSIAMLYGMAMMFGGVGSSLRAKRQSMMPIVELVKEYELIQQKKSNLSKNQREYVAYQFKEIFEEAPAKPKFEDFFLNSIELEGKGVDMYVNYVEWKDGEPLTDEELDSLLDDTDLHSSLVTYKCYGI